jgi:tripartite-type tricarboxylate transporter receptor subunit TctC
MPYDTLKDLAPVGMVASRSTCWWSTTTCRPGTQGTAGAGCSANPASYTYGSAGAAAPSTCRPKLFKAVGGVAGRAHPYRGGGPALTDTIAGQVDMSFPVLSAARATCRPASCARWASPVRSARR